MGFGWAITNSTHAKTEQHRAWRGWTQALRRADSLKILAAAAITVHFHLNQPAARQLKTKYHVLLLTHSLLAHEGSTCTWCGLRTSLFLRIWRAETSCGGTTILRYTEPKKKKATSPKEESAPRTSSQIAIPTGYLNIGLEGGTAKDITRRPCMDREIGFHFMAPSILLRELLKS